METLLKIVRNGYVIENAELPSYFTDVTSDYEYFVETKRHLREVFEEFYHSESFKTTDETRGVKTLHFYLNEMLDGLFIAQENGKMNYLKEQLEKINNPVKVDPTEEVF